MACFYAADGIENEPESRPLIKIHKVWHVERKAAE